MKKIKFILLAAVSILAVACGTEGPQGPAGTNGTDGNANVMYSDWFTSGTWTGGGTTYGYFDKAASQITQTVLDNGVVLAYAKLTADGTTVRPLPITTSSGATTVIWNYTLTAVGNIRFDFTSVSAATWNPSPDNQFRYIVIPGGTHLRLSKPLREMTYEAVCDMFNIPL